MFKEKETNISILNLENIALDSRFYERRQVEKKTKNTFFNETISELDHKELERGDEIQNKSKILGLKEAKNKNALIALSCKNKGLKKWTDQSFTFDDALQDFKAPGKNTWIRKEIRSNFFNKEWCFFLKSKNDRLLSRSRWKLLVYKRICSSS